MWRLRLKYGIEARRKKRMPIAGTDLCLLIEELQTTAPNIGISMIEGALSACGVYASRSDIADMLIQMNPIGAVLRWNEQILRDSYHVAGI